jgi:hypothetical protein
MVDIIQGRNFVGIDFKRVQALQISAAGLPLQFTDAPIEQLFPDAVVFSAVCRVVLVDKLSLHEEAPSADAEFVRYLQGLVKPGGNA